MRRSDLPLVGALPPAKQRAAIDAMWRAYNRAELRGQGGDVCPVSYVATFAEVLEAALGVLSLPSVQPPGELVLDAPAIALREGGPWTLVTDLRVPPGTVLVGAPEQVERILTDWTRRSLGEPIEVKPGEVAVLHVERPA